MTEDLLNEAQRLLAEERAALIAADFPALDAISARKEGLAESLRLQRLPVAAATAIRREAERNAVLISAAARGVRAASRRIAEIRAANGPLKTYSRDGQSQAFGASGAALERRA